MLSIIKEIEIITGNNIKSQQVLFSTHKDILSLPTQ